MAQNELAKFFDKIYIINLASRQDRRDEMQAQLVNIGLSLTHPRIQLFHALRPTEKGEWPSIGARGCFMSHLNVLKDACSHGHTKILVVEDDLNFVEDFNSKFIEVANILKSTAWDLFYGGYKILDECDPMLTNRKVNVVNSQTLIETAHFIAFNGVNIANAYTYLRTLASRCSGDPLGGPMHVDGAYCWYRKEFKERITLVATPQLGYQRSSRTDISDLRWIDTIPIIKNAMSILRKLKNLK